MNAIIHAILALISLLDYNLMASLASELRPRRARKKKFRHFSFAEFMLENSLAFQIQRKHLMLQVVVRRSFVFFHLLLLLYSDLEQA